MSILASASITLVRVDDGAKGDTGVGIASVDVYYYLSASSTSLSGGSWSTTAPTWVDGKYIWSKTVTTNTNGTSTESGAVCITGQKGATGVQGPQGEIGETGTGIESITEQYYLSASKDSPPTEARGNYNITSTQNDDGTQILSIIDAVDSGNYNITSTQNDDGTQTLSITTDDIWSEAPPTWSTGKYIWTRSKIVYKNPTSIVYTTPVCDSSWEAVNELEDDMNEVVDSKTNALQEKVSADKVTLESMINQEAGRINSLSSLVENIRGKLQRIVSDDDHATMFEQTGESYIFNFFETQQKHGEDLEEYRGRVILGNEDDGSPFVRIQTSDESAIKLKLDNESMAFLDKSGEVIGEIEADDEGRLGIAVDNETVTGELRQSNPDVTNGEFVWQVRRNGNYGLSWKEIDRT